jgi:hypothetical protein
MNIADDKIEILDTIRYRSVNYRQLHGVNKEFVGRVTHIFRDTKKPLSIGDTLLLSVAYHKGKKYTDIFNIYDEIYLEDKSRLFDNNPKLRMIRPWPHYNTPVAVCKQHEDNTDGDHQDEWVTRVIDSIKYSDSELHMSILDITNSPTLQCLIAPNMDAAQREFSRYNFDSPTLKEDCWLVNSYDALCKALSGNISVKQYFDIPRMPYSVSVNGY